MLRSLISIYFKKLWSPIYIIIYLGLCQLSCSSFRGPGYYKSPNEYRKPAYIAPKWSSNTKKLHINHGHNAQGTPRFIWPINRARLTQKFSPKKNPSHAGLDLAHKKGTPIIASHSGQVIFAGKKYSGYGNMIILEYNNTWATLYAHLDKITVSTKDYVKKGALLGTMGRTGRATGVHLHFELIHNKTPINPLTYLDK
jgi:murein DD-endopeptidase MepM/ murein hydrolase activator NlpD